jgi:hypothetical protein
MEEEWAAMASKYGYGIDADQASKEELIEFAQTTMYLHEDLTDTDLWCAFQEQFKGFTIESFQKIRNDVRSKLRKHLIKRGVYVGKNSNRVTLSELLYKVLQQEEQPEWTDKDLESTIKELREPLLTKVMQDRLNPTHDGLATGLSVQPIATTTIVLARTQQ